MKLYIKVISIIMALVVSPVYAGSIELNQATLEDSSMLIRAITGQTIVYDNGDAKKKITLNASNVDNMTILRLLDASLRSHKLTLVEVESGYEVVNIFKAYKSSPMLTTNLDKSVGYISHIIKLKDRSYKDVINLLKIVVGDGGKIIEQKTMGGVMIMAMRENVIYAKELIDAIETTTETRKSKFISIDFADIPNIVKQVASLKLPTINVVPDKNNNQLYVSGTAADFEKAVALIDGMNKKKEKVIIEVLIAEISESENKSVGVQMGVGGKNGIGVTNFTGTEITSMESLLKGISGGSFVDLSIEDGGTIGAAFGGGSISMTVLAQAIKKYGDSTILSTPIINTIDGSEASFVVGKNVPFATKIEGSSASENPFTSFTREDVGLQLTILPRILSSGEILIEVSQEISSITEGTTVDGIVTDKRSLETVTISGDGNLVVLGGLIDRAKDGKESKVPVLGDIPYIGNLFSHEKKSERKRKLLIFLRPSIEKGTSKEMLDKVVKTHNENFLSEYNIYDQKTK